MPLEDLSGILARSSQPSVAGTSAAEQLHPLVAAAYSARTLQQRLEHAKAALREGDQTAATDARLILTSSLPGLSPAAQLRSLISTAEAAVAAADKEAAAKPRRQGLSSLAHQTQLTLQQRAAVRAVMALFRCRVEHA